MAPSEPVAGRLFVVAGPSGAGKSSVVAGLRKRRPLYFSVSVITRQPRPGETNGVHYWFIQPEEFERLVASDALLEWAEYDGRFYGTLRKPVLENLAAGHDVLLEIDIQGARQVRKSYPEAIMFFIIPPSIEHLRQRLRRRGDTSDQDIRRRLQIAQTEMDEAEDLFDHIVVNDDLVRAITEVDELMGRPTPHAEAQAEK